MLTSQSFSLSSAPPLPDQASQVRVSQSVSPRSPADASDQTGQRWSEPVWSLFGIIVFVAFLAILRRIFHRKSSGDPTVASGKRAEADLQSLPCFRCKFFYPNMHLACAVNPLSVMTEQARDCQDFCAKKVAR